jgi:hypothetical protein
MKKLLLMIACTAAFSAPVIAQQTTYACQYTASGGLYWEKGTWETSRFVLKKPFFLSSINGSLTTVSVANVFLDGAGDPNVTHCHPITSSKTQTCSDQYGRSLTFSHTNGLGAKAVIFGGTIRDDEKKDTLVVAPFTCSKM